MSQFVAVYTLASSFPKACVGGCVHTSTLYSNMGEKQFFLGSLNKGESEAKFERGLGPGNS